MRILKLLSILFISTPLIQLFKIICSKLYLQEIYTASFPISTLSLSVSYHLFFVQLPTHSIIFELFFTLSSFRVISSCVITVCILLLRHSTIYHINSAQLSLSKKVMTLDILSYLIFQFHISLSIFLPKSVMPPSKLTFQPPKKIFGNSSFQQSRPMNHRKKQLF